MSEIFIETAAYAKLILHAVKYPHCAVNGIILARQRKDGSSKDLEIVDAIPLFHHSHYVSPMAEVALTQIEAVAKPANLIIAGYYAACENFDDNTIDKCPGQKIAEKIAENFSSAVFIVVDNKNLMKHLTVPAIKVHQYNDGKWKEKSPDAVLFPDVSVLQVTSQLMEKDVHRELVDFDNHLDDLSLDWSNVGIHKLVNSMAATCNE